MDVHRPVDGLHVRGGLRSFGDQPTDPMRYAIISDIHSNLEALTTALAHIDTIDIDRIVCLGDIVGYGADPAACLDLVRSRTEYVVMGNHDFAAVHVDAAGEFNEYAAGAVAWTARQLSPADKAYLRTLPYRVSLDDLLFVHSTPDHPERMTYIRSPLDARSRAGAFTERVCFFGHSHHPGVFPLDHHTRVYDSEHRFMLNPGSVGQPRDSDARLAFGVLDTVAGTWDVVRLDYDIDTASRKIKDAGLGDFLALRLYIGE